MGQYMYQNIKLNMFCYHFGQSTFLSHSQYDEIILGIILEVQQYFCKWCTYSYDVQVNKMFVNANLANTKTMVTIIIIYLFT